MPTSLLCRRRRRSLYAVLPEFLRKATGRGVSRRAAAQYGDQIGAPPSRSNNWSHRNLSFSKLLYRRQVCRALPLAMATSAKPRSLRDAEERRVCSFPISPATPCTGMRPRCGRIREERSLFGTTTPRYRRSRSPDRLASSNTRGWRVTSRTSPKKVAIRRKRNGELAPVVWTAPRGF